MIEDLIKRSDAIKSLDNAWINGTSLLDANETIKQLNAIPSADRPQGEWIVRFPYEDTGKIRMCSNCNITQTVNVYDGMVRFKFCPYCGAKMRGINNE